MYEHFFQCPYCWEEISMLLDSSIGVQQVYIEDCEVCCNPIEIMCRFSNDEIMSFQAQSLGQ